MGCNTLVGATNSIGGIISCGLVRRKSLADCRVAIWQSFALCINETEDGPPVEALCLSLFPAHNVTRSRVKNANDLIGIDEDDAVFNGVKNDVGNGFFVA